MRAAVTGTTGQVVNVIIVEDDTFDPGDGLTLTALPDDSPVGPGWRLVSGAWVAPPRRDLAVDRASIPADGTTAATVTYTDTHDDAPTSVVFTVNGLDSNAVDLVDAAAALQVTSTTPGDVIEVTVGELSLSIQVEEVV